MTRQRFSTIHACNTITTTKNNQMSRSLFRGKTILCVGRNYPQHALELQNPIPTSPFFFLKPASALVFLTSPTTSPTTTIPIPPSSTNPNVQHEIELAIEVNSKASRLTLHNAMEHVTGYRLAIDVTARQWQEEAKKTSKPWTLSKGFDYSCPIGPLIPKETISDINQIEIWLKVNQHIKQQGQMKDALFSIPQLLVHATRWMTLNEGDLLLTGTPSGVGPLVVGDEVEFGGIGPNMKFKCSEWI
jgi:acylpyruvate hydrolase